MQLVVDILAGKMHLHCITSGILMGGFGFLFPQSRKKRNIFKFCVMQYSSPSNASCILTSFYSWKLCIGPTVLLISWTLWMRIELDLSKYSIQFSTQYTLVSCHSIAMLLFFAKVFLLLPKKKKKKQQTTNKKPSHTCRLRKEMVQLVLWTFAIT